MLNNKSIAYLFKSGRVERSQSNDEYPDDFFYGYRYVKNKNENTRIVDITKMGISGPMNVVMTALTIPVLYITGLHLAVIFRLLSRKEKLNESDVLIASTSSLGTAIAFLNTLGLIKSKLVFIVMGLGDLLNNPIRRYVLRNVLKNTIVVSISKGELEHINKILDKSIDIKYLPFGVDHKYWRVSSDVSSDYVLSIGNDLNRDYELLLSVWKTDYPELKIITKHDIKSRLPNVTIIKGDWNEQVLSDEQIRTYIQQANFIVVPVNQTSQPSGQSFCLQSMACGKAVIMSNIIGLWDRDSLLHQKNCLLYEPENKESLKVCVEKMISQYEMKNNIGFEARKLIDNKFNSNVTGMTILSFLNSVVSD
jgi:glycosyltransferase involved in cell wall biosynthesis